VVRVIIDGTVVGVAPAAYLPQAGKSAMGRHRLGAELGRRHDDRQVLRAPVERRLGRVASTAGDGLVCPTCCAAEEHGPYPIATPPVIPLCDGCRCALVSVLPPLRNAG
jgi:hypothetical protein